MNNKLINRAISLTGRFKDLPTGKNKHFTFIFDKNKLVAMGYNSYLKTHSKASSLGYKFERVHSEVSALIKSRHRLEDLSGCTLINTRINIFDELGYCKPCLICRDWIQKTGFKQVIYINRDGDFEQLGN